MEVKQRGTYDKCVMADPEILFEYIQYKSKIFCCFSVIFRVNFGIIISIGSTALGGPLPPLGVS